MKKNIQKKVRDTLGGAIVDSRVFKRHLVMTLFIIVSCIYVIAARFSHATAQSRARALAREIEVAKTEKQYERSRYMTLTRESAMIRLVDSLNLGLTVPDVRPTTLVME